MTEFTTLSDALVRAYAPEKAAYNVRLARMNNTSPTSRDTRAPCAVAYDPHSALLHKFHEGFIM